MHVPEFLLAYQRANSGGVTYGIPKPKYADADKTAHPDKYQKQHDEYFVALKKFIQTHPESMSGVELELSGMNPQSKWALVANGAEEARAAAGTGTGADEVSRDASGYRSGRTRGGESTAREIIG